MDVRELIVSHKRRVIATRPKCAKKQFHSVLDYTTISTEHKAKKQEHEKNRAKVARCGDPVVTTLNSL